MPESKPAVQPALDQNLDALSRASARIRYGLKRTHEESLQRFYHLLLMECAERMSEADFARSIEIAIDQLGSPA